MAATIEDGARFTGFFQLGIVGELPTGGVFLVTWPEGLVARMPDVDVAFEFRSYVGGYALACSPDACALFSMPSWSGFFERVPGGAVPGGAGYTSLRWEDFLLCVSGEEEPDLCFDRVLWTTSDGGRVTSPAHDGGVDASVPQDGGPDATPPRDGAVTRRTADARPAQVSCDAPIYCDAPELADDPLCLYEPVGAGYIRGVTQAGRMIEGNHDGTGVAHCLTVSPPFGPPIGLASSSCGILNHVVLLTAEGLFETCGCAID